MSAKLITIQEKPFVNEFGNVINPGQPVIVITDRYKSVKVNPAKYIGMNGKKVVVLISSRRWVYDPGTRQGHYKEVMVRSHLQRNRIYPITATLSQFIGKSF